MKISANSQQFLNVMVKVNTAKLATLEDSIKSKKKLANLFKNPVSKLLIARLKDTGVLYNFIVTLNIITH